MGEEMKWFYEVLMVAFARRGTSGRARCLAELVKNGHLTPCTAIDLGSGTAGNCIFLAQHGFEVTGVDFAQAAIDLGNQRAQAANVRVNFIRDDLTHLQHVRGTFDLLVDYGTLDDLKPPQRDRYLQNVLPLAHPGSRFLLYCFEWELRWYERPDFSLSMALLPGEA